MRPRTLDEFVGQQHIIGQGRLLKRAIQVDQLSSLIFYGPPGTGKTTLAQIIANATKAHFIAINAVLAGIRDIRSAVETAQQERQERDRRTLLFVDEVHRFNKAQQDALLPWVENGTIVLIGATTENPYFEVNKALVSRSRVFRLLPLTEAELRDVATQTLTDRERGYGNRTVQIEEAALQHLLNVANGDARTLLNALELAVETTEPEADGSIQISLAVAEDSIQQRAVLYDKEGDIHFDTISAFIKSVRGSDADAALYWLARMVYAGEDPRYIFRRMLILACEDVGLADPQAAIAVNACAEIFDRIGLPEGHYPLAQAAIYLATAPKSNSAMGFFDALAAVGKQQQADVPSHLKDANRDKKQFGHGVGYRYPHAYRDHWVAQQYLPAALQGQIFYQPSDSGFEGTIQLQVTRRREAQLAALAAGIGTEVPEVLTYGEKDPASERWLQRTLGQTGERLAEIRDRIFATAALQRHHLVMVLNAGDGLLVWEAVRQAPEGGVCAIAQTEAEATTLQQQAASLPELQRPQIACLPWEKWPKKLAKIAPDWQCDRILGRNALARAADKLAAIQSWMPLLQSEGQVILAEAIPKHAQRLYRLLEPDWLDADLYDRLVEAEEAIYSNPDDAMVNWDVEELRSLFTQASFSVEISVERSTSQTHLSEVAIGRWFGAAKGKRPTYASHLRRHLAKAEVERVRSLFLQRLANQPVDWSSQVALIQASKVRSRQP